MRVWLNTLLIILFACSGESERATPAQEPEPNRTQERVAESERVEPAAQQPPGPASSDDPAPETATAEAATAEAATAEAATAEAPASGVEEGRARCSAGFEALREGRLAEATPLFNEGIVALARGTDAAARRSLGMCLYNRGRAAEAREETEPAIRDYALSLLVRPNDTVVQRLRSMAPAAPASAPAGILVLLENGESYTHEFVDLEVDQVSAAGKEWVVMTLPGEDLETGAFVTTEACGAAQVVEIDRIQYSAGRWLSLEDVRVVRAGSLGSILQIELSGHGDDNCGLMDGVNDYEHRATSFVWLEGCELKFATVLVDHEDCYTERRAVDLERRGSVVTLSNPRGSVPSSGVGRFELAELARRGLPL